MRPFGMPSVRRLHLYLIKPSKYDDDGYVIRYWRGVLPSNTLACLYGLTEDVRSRGALGGGLDWRVRVIDETVQRVDVRAIRRACRDARATVVVCLAGVQSNQFARAADLARACRAAGASVLIGGFHVSGSIALLPEAPPEIRALMDEGVTVVAGEVEGRWEGLLRDALNGSLRPLYNFLLQPPPLETAPLPSISPGYLRRFVSRRFGTLDCSRGCPFNCSFCTVINVQGRAMRFRGVEGVLRAIRENRGRGIGAYFFTDDNFCRNRHWEAIFDGLIRLRAGGVDVSFMMQADTQSFKLPRFIEKAKAAGCTQVFIGLESLNPQNLEAAGKRQNRVDEFRAAIEAYRQAGINTHVAYIIGFPFDDEASVARDIEALQASVGPEQASFFMLTPLPGSRDHLGCVEAGVRLDRDLNRFDSFHATVDHPRMSREGWARAYGAAWRSFYGRENMQRILQRVSAENYWAVFANFIWYKHSTMVEREHPMIAGFVRLKGRRDRRPGFPVEGRWSYLRRRLGDVWRYARLWPRLALEMEEVWLQTRPRSALEARVVEELRRIPAAVQGWRRMRAAQLRRAHLRAAASLRRVMPQGAAGLGGLVPSRVRLWLARWNPCAYSLTWTRRPLNRFWRQCLVNLRRGHLERVHVAALAFNAAQEAVLFGTFAAAFFARLLRRLGRTLPGTR